MAKNLTDNELMRVVFADALEQNPSPLNKFSEGFRAGLSHNQAKLDKLISYIKGEITRSEIEDLLCE